MPFWSSEKLKDRIPGSNLITPYDPKCVEHGAYELSVGPETFLTSDSSGKKQELDNQGQFVIPPGQLALLITEEEVTIPLDAISFISIKASIKFRGLVNVSGFHVDPGFHGRLKFSVYNAGSQNIILSRRQRAFLIWFSDLDRETNESYDGAHLNQKDITAEDVMRVQGEIASPGQLKKEIHDLQNSLNNVKYALGILATLIVGIAVAIFRITPSVGPSTPTAQPSSAIQKPSTEQGQAAPPLEHAPPKTTTGSPAPSKKATKEKQLDSGQPLRKELSPETPETHKP